MKDKEDQRFTCWRKEKTCIWVAYGLCRGSRPVRIMKFYTLLRPNHSTSSRESILHHQFMLLRTILPHFFQNHVPRSNCGYFRRKLIPYITSLYNSTCSIACTCQAAFTDENRPDDLRQTLRLRKVHDRPCGPHKTWSATSSLQSP